MPRFETPHRHNRSAVRLWAIFDPPQPIPLVAFQNREIASVSAACGVVADQTKGTVDKACPETSVRAQARIAGVAVDADNRQRDDFYPTPPEGTGALLRVESFDGPIWEPACGDGAISRVLIEAGYTVISSDLVDRGYGEPRVDFLLEWQSRAPNVVTNPPFNQVAGFMRQALRLSTGKVALLLRLQCLEGTERSRIYQSTPLARGLGVLKPTADRSGATVKRHLPDPE
jgi:hypothetical protein